MSLRSLCSRHHTERVAQVEREIRVQESTRSQAQDERCEAASQRLSVTVVQRLENRSEAPMHGDRAEAHDFEADFGTEFAERLPREIEKVRGRVNLPPVQALQSREQRAEIAGRQEQMTAGLQ